MNRQQLFVGIDGGGTHSYGVLADVTGQILAQSRSGSLNFHGGGMDRARSSLQELMRGFGTIPTEDIAQIVIGSAALFAESDAREKQKLCEGIVSLGRCRLVGDALTAYFGACGNDPGVLVIAGTGSIVLTRNAAGKFSSVGGWGHLLGDAGSAWWIALESIKAAIASSEGLGPDTLLDGLTCEYFKVRDLKDIVPVLYAPGFMKNELAGAAQFFSNRAGDDPVFQSICQRGGEALGAQAVAAAPLGKITETSLTVFLAGGVLEKNMRVRESLLETMRQNLAIEVREPKLPAWLGAVAMAMQGAGIELTPDLLARLKTSYAQAQAKPKS